VIKWEYNILKWSNHADVNELDKLGKEGWELVSVTCDYNYNYCAFFKREIR
jgi:hypothetical protein